MDDFEVSSVGRGRFVRSVQATQSLDDESDQDSMGYGCRFENLAERRSVDVLEGDHRLIIGEHHVDDGNDVRVRDGCRRAGLLEQLCRALGVAAQVSLEALDGYPSSESSGPGEFGQVHRRHSP